MEDLARVSFGWAARQKPSFDGERSDSLSRISLPGAEVESLDLEQLFDAHWFGPCTWLGSAWASGWSGARDERLPSPVPPTTPAATPAAGAEPPPPPFRSGSKSSAPAGRTPKESSSPPKAMPVPRRAPNGSAGEGADGDDNNLPVALPVEPAPALPADPSTAVVGPASTTPCANGGTEPMELGPQLGTWANRQFRLLDPAEQSRTDADRAGSVNNGDQLEEALAYLAATGATTTTTVSLQIANTSSARGGRRMARNESSGGQGPCGTMSRDGSLVLGQMGSLVGTLGGGPSTLGNADWPLGASGSGSFTSGPRLLGRQPSGEMLQASREVASLNRRAAVVLQQQLDCEQQADRRVQESLAQGPPWVGHYIPVVQIDEWGSFRFLMLKLRDQSMARGTTVGAERQRILIRGHNYGSEGQLMEECNREILGQSQRNNVPFEAPTVMGGGVMEWRRDRDRHLHLHSGFVMDRSLPSAGMLSGLGPTAMGGSGRPASAIDLLNLAAALARQSFPPTYKITVLT
eukprot:XP_001694075.1 predicted protein [Chlamydomonas reinhardtii]